MSLPRRLVALLVVTAVAPLAAPSLGAAEAANIIIGSKTKKEANGKHYRLHTTVAEPDAGSISTVSVTVSSDAGRESPTTYETDAWLHGAASLPTAPEADAWVELTVYDAGSAALVTFSGTVDADGRVALEAEPGEFVCSKLGCGYTPLPDVELLGADVHATADGAELAVDLAGSAAGDAAYAAVRVTPCDLTAEAGICLYDGNKTQTAEVGWDTLGTVWTADLALSHEGPIDVRVRVRADGGGTEVVHTSLGLPWDDGAKGVSTLAADEDPLTTLALMAHDGETLLTAFSDGWTAETAPRSAEVVLTDGTTLTIPANSFQRRAPELLLAEWDETIDTYLLTIDGSAVTIDGGSLTFADLSSPLCVESTCVVLFEDDGSAALSVTQYRWDTNFVRGETSVVLKGIGADGASTVLVDAHATFEDEVSVVFANVVDFAGDPVNSALAGQVRLLDDGGRSVASGRFYASVDRHEAGGLGLAGVGPDEVATATELAALEVGPSTSCGDEASGYTAPPPVAAVAGNGSGTRAAASTTSTKPQLL